MSEREIRAAYEAHKDAVFRFAWRMTGSAAAAEDVLQECFLFLVRRPDGYDPGRGPLRPFLLGVARNFVRARWRAEGRGEAMDEEAFAAPAAAVSEDGAAVAGAVAALPPLQREAVILFEYEGLTLEEIARMAEVDVGTVKSRLHRGRENLRRMLAPLRAEGRGARK